jgi:malate dehydrogenase
MKPKRVAIIGAVGTVGSCTAFAIATQGLADELVLLDTKSDMARSHAMDLRSAIIGVCETAIQVGESIEDLAGCGVVIVAASAPWQRISSRMEVLSRNLPIIEELAQRLRTHCPDAIVINAVNPVDPLSYVLWRRSGIQRRQCLGYALNDSVRLRGSVAKALMVPSTVVDALAIGEHGEHNVLLFSSIRVRDKAVQLEASVRQRIQSDLSRVLQDFESLGTGRTTGWTCAVGISSMVRAILEDTGEVFPCSVVLDGEYGRHSFSATLPVRLGQRGIDEWLPVSMAADERKQLESCFDFLEHTVQSLEQV